MIVFLLLATALVACRKDEFEERIIPSTWTKVTQGVSGSRIKGFFLLNEGNMGSNKASLDYFDYTTGYYMRNIFAELNPSVVNELGDVGNDLQIYGDKLYAVINCSHFVEVMDLATAKHRAVVSIPNCRYIVFHDRYAYVSSYAGPVSLDPNARLGYVAKVDTATLRVVAQCTVGYQPEGMVVVGDKLYVANSGGYRAPNYDNTISVIDLTSFTQTQKIEVAINLHQLEKDNYGNIYITSRGDYYAVPSQTLIFNTVSQTISQPFGPLPVSCMSLSGDMLYLCSTQWSYVTNTNTVNYAKIDTRTQKIITKNFISDGSEKNITRPYGVAFNQENGEFMVADAKNYISPGMLYCFNADGTKKWEVQTGDIPAHIVFTHKQLKINK